MESRVPLLLLAACVVVLLLLPPAPAAFLGKKSALAAKKIAAISSLCGYRDLIFAQMKGQSDSIFFSLYPQVLYQFREG